jgi:hypothetical protein
VTNLCLGSAGDVIWRCQVVDRTLSRLTECICYAAAINDLYKAEVT